MSFLGDWIYRVGSDHNSENLCDLRQIARSIPIHFTLPAHPLSASASLYVRGDHILRLDTQNHGSILFLKHSIGERSDGVEVWLHVAHISLLYSDIKCRFDHATSLRG